MGGAITDACRMTPGWPLIINLRLDPCEVIPNAAMYVRD